ncbi:MAG: dihydroorotase [Coprococcus sp.]|nr:dihydroorotase [Coprococcus sp.]
MKKGNDIILIKNGIVVNPADDSVGKSDVLISGELICDVAEDISLEYAKTVKQENGISGEVKLVDAGGAYVMPGFVDLHVHFRDPGQTYKEDIETGASAAAHGGVTTVCAMPNTNPAVDSIETLQYVENKAEKKALINVRQVSAITKGMNNDELVDMKAMYEAGAVSFSEDGKSVMDINLYRKAMQTASELGAVIMAHCEDKNLVNKGVLNQGAASEKYHVPGISNAVEDVITARDIFLAGETGAKLHLCHCSTEASVELVRMAKKLGYAVTAEVCPHHFTMCDSDIDKVDANYKMNPPLRTERDVQALIKGLIDGTMECISTDHAPHSAEEKAKDFVNAPFGITGLETSAALTYTALVKTGLLSILDMAKKMSYNPARVIGIADKRGYIAKGAVADIVIFDADRAWVVNADDMYSKSKNTPYIGKQLQGKVVTTICSGNIVYSEL